MVFIFSERTKKRLPAPLSQLNSQNEWKMTQAVEKTLFTGTDHNQIQASVAVYCNGSQISSGDYINKIQNIKSPLCHQQHD